MKSGQFLLKWYTYSPISTHFFGMTSLVWKRIYGYSIYTYMFDLQIVTTNYNVTTKFHTPSPLQDWGSCKSEVMEDMKWERGNNKQMGHEMRGREETIIHKISACFEPWREEYDRTTSTKWFHRQKWRTRLGIQFKLITNIQFSSTWNSHSTEMDRIMGEI